MSSEDKGRLPEVIIHNSVSLDGSLTGFNLDMDLHYRVMRNLKPDLHLVGSNTAKTGIDMEEIPQETKNDFKKPNREGI